MKELIIGTTNQAKVNQIKGALLPLGIIVNGVEDKSLLPEVIEDGLTAQANAQKKALAYAQALGKTVLSMDNALYIEGLESDKQPGINVRRINGRTDRPTDQEILEHYQLLVSGLGDGVSAHWEFAICVVTPEGKISETTIISPRIFVSKLSQIVTPGYPLESMQIDPSSGQYISEMTRDQQDLFWQKAIGKELCDFVKSLEF